jgi:D-beta-D-heptose 7-phosphate kinase/D-beta-D-heptose 1-phosphate adenosyltransferase
MDFSSFIQNKITTLKELQKTLARIRTTENQKIVFTNGCFDLLHPGHLKVIHAAKSYSDFLIVGVNTDKSVANLKPGRPIQNEDTRALMLAALAAVDAVILFSEETPIELIKNIKPDIIVKGGDYKPEEVVGKNVVDLYGGRIEIVPLLVGFSTSDIITKVIAIK